MALEIKRSEQPAEDALTHARQVVQAQIATHTNAIIELKTQYNNMSPSSRLPPEILSEIFTLVAVDHFQSMRKMHYGSFRAYKWIALTHVCRAWRNIALNTPRLWSRIIVTQSDMALEVLSRSRKAPLHVSATVNAPDDPRAAVLDAIVKEPSRLEELHVTAPARMVHAWSSKWTQPADNLEKLSLDSDLKAFDHSSLFASSSLCPQLFSGHAPSLRHLDVQRIAIDWNHPLFCETLRSLTIHANYDITPKLGVFTQLLDALVNMKQLERLQLNEAIPRLAEEGTHSPEVQRTVMLPNLQLIDLFSDGTECAQLLRHLSLPPTVKMIVNGRTERGAADLVRVYSDHLSRAEPLETVRLAPRFSSQIHVQGWRSYVESGLAHQKVPEADAELCLDAYPNSRSLQALVRESTFLSRIFRFEIQTTFRNWDWPALLSRMPEIRMLSVTGQPELTLFTTLLRLRSDADDFDEPADPAAALPARHLHTLELNGVRFGCAHSDHESLLFERLVALLILRCNYGAPILRLVLRGCVNASEEDVARLRELVPDVEWDARELTEGADFIEYLSDEEGHGHAMYDDDIAMPLWDAYDDAEDDLEFWMIPFGF
ncbi:hypothetical protein BD413DRAFT_615043 [Trametes elegans]|nr:hypothetical protein BD413DRAFT_615043 [Trametes elegans]